MAKPDRRAHAARIDQRIGRHFTVRHHGDHVHPRVGPQVAFRVEDRRGRAEVLKIAADVLDDPDFDEAKWIAEQMMQVHP